MILFLKGDRQITMVSKEGVQIYEHRVPLFRAGEKEWNWIVEGNEDRWDFQCFLSWSEDSAFEFGFRKWHFRAWNEQSMTMKVNRNKTCP